MKASNQLWKDRLDGKLPEPLAEEIDTFETEIELRRQDKVDEKVFAETRLRRGVYGQRYDNGQRYDGQETKQLAFPRRQAAERTAYSLGRTGDDADQNPLRRDESGAA